MSRPQLDQQSNVWRRTFKRSASAHFNMTLILRWCAHAVLAMAKNKTKEQGMSRAWCGALLRSGFIYIPTQGAGRVMWWKTGARTSCKTEKKKKRSEHKNSRETSGGRSKTKGKIKLCSWWSSTGCYCVCKTYENNKKKDQKGRYTKNRVKV